MKIKSINLALLSMIVLSLSITAAYATMLEKTLLDGDASFSINKDKKGSEGSQGTENNQVVRPGDQIDQEEGIRVAAGDINADGFDDVFAGAGGGEDAGEGSFRISENESPTAN